MYLLQSPYLLTYRSLHAYIPANIVLHLAVGLLVCVRIAIAHSANHYG